VFDLIGGLDVCFAGCLLVRCLIAIGFWVLCWIVAYLLVSFVGWV